MNDTSKPCTTYGCARKQHDGPHMSLYEALKASVTFYSYTKGEKKMEKRRVSEYEEKLRREQIALRHVLRELESVQDIDGAVFKILGAARAFFSEGSERTP